MKIGIYNEPAEGGLGGSEVSVAVLAEALAADHEVEIVHHKPYMVRERLAEISGTELSSVSMRQVAGEPYSFGDSHDPWRRFREARDWHAALSEPYDLFVNFTHGFPPFCHAKKGALVVLFPFHIRPHLQATEDTRASDEMPLWNRLKTVYHEWEWQKRLDTYQIKTTISRFSQAWTRRRWGIDCEIVYPPADMLFQPGEKEKLILSVGRFTATGHSKKQLEMVRLFGELQSSACSDWQYLSVGNLSETSTDLEYFADVNREASACRARVLANVERCHLKQLYNDAGIFWHAAGYADDGARPELAEHFGIATVEAMSAGCVPIVINRGGQPEIVEHGVSGFVWNTLEEFRGYTELVVRDSQLRSQMAGAARRRAALFSREQFLRRFCPLL